MFKSYKAINQITNNNSSKLVRIFILGIIVSFLKIMPYGVLILSVLELFNPLLNEGVSIDVTKLWQYFIIMIILYILQFFIGKIQYISSFRDCTKIINEGRSTFAGQLKKLPMGFFSNYDPGQFSTYMLADYENVQTLLSDGLEPIISAIVTPLGGFICMLFINWRLALWMMLSVLIAVPATLLAQRISGKLGKRLLNSRTRAASRMVEYLMSIQLVKTFNLQGEKFERLEKSFENLRKDSLKQEVFTGLGVVFGKVFLYAGIPILITTGYDLLTKGLATIPVYVMFLMVAPKIYNSLAGVIMLSAMIGFYLRSVDRIKNVYDEKTLPEKENTKHINSRDIDIEDITFRYENINVLDRVSAHIPEKSITALVGTSGSGKTTITRLIARFWDVNKGRITVGGVDLRDMEYDYLINNISIVFQDVFLFHDSITNNINLGNKNATKEQIMNAAKKANAHDFIMSLPKGYDTVVGEGGSTLSGGEKQRISIARAILKDAPIILLDEATSSLDPENEACIQTAISRLVEDKTLIVIAHKLKTIVSADQIIVLEEGRITETGKHNDLLQNNGLYSRMWKEQQKAKGWRLKVKENI